MLVPSSSPIKNPTKEVIAPAHNLFPFLCVYSDKYEGLLKKVLLVSMFLKWINVMYQTNWTEYLSRDLGTKLCEIDDFHIIFNFPPKKFIIIK